jgi:hypothetical protein
MGAGILPIAEYNGHDYLLFSREYLKRKGKVDWRDFGGKSENNETIEETAIREGWEETAGFLGSKNNIKKLIKNNIKKISTKTYTTYIVRIKYDKDLPKKFREHFKKMYNKDKSKICKNGFYEKDMLKWIRVDKLKQNMPLFFPWYKKIIKQLYL